MYVVWTKDIDDGKHVLFVDHTLEKIQKKFKKFVEKEDFCEDVYKELKEKNLEDDVVHICNYDHDDHFYISKINIEDKQATKLYIFEFTEDGEGGSYHNWTMITFATSLNKILNTARNYFCSESRRTTEKDVNKMIKSLKKNHRYTIPEGLSYLCDMRLYKIKI